MRELLKEIFLGYYGDVYGYLYSFSRDAALSEDLASEVFLEAVKSIGTFRGDSDVKTWLFSIARHKWFGYLRQKKKSPQWEPLEELYVSNGRTPESDLLNKELADKIGKLLDSEPERTGTVVRLRLEGYSFYEIGKRCGISENSARVIDYRAKRKIREALRKEGLLDV